MEISTLRQRPYAEPVAQKLVDDGIHPVIARVLAARAITSAASVSLRLRELEPPDTLRDLDRAAEIVAQAVLTTQKICVVGDYDCDGATATALLTDFLTQVGADVDYLIPDRIQDGYGLSPALAERAKHLRANLLITVDNGISAFAGVAAAHKLGMRVVITDHHLPADTIPEADAMVNPNHPECAFPWKSTCGVGVAFYLAAAVRRVLVRAGHAPALGLDMAQFLDLVALGTVADVVPLERNNRILVQGGLNRMRQGLARPGLQALMRVAGVSHASIQSDDLGFRLGPRINAAGRIDDMRIGVRLLLSRDPEEAQDLAKTLDSLNAERRSVEADMLAKAEEHAECLLSREKGTSNAAERRVLCILDEDGHEGVVGLVAGRIKEATGLPTVVFAPAADPNLLKGSARSIAHVHIRDMLAEVQARYPEILQTFGGHAMAAGLTIPKTQYARFVEAFEAIARDRVPDEALDPVIWTDGPLAPEHFSLALAQEFEAMGPYGNAFAAPIFHNTFRVEQAERIGKDGQTLRLSLLPGPNLPPLAAVRFRQGEEADPEPGSRWTCVFSLTVNRFRGEEKLQAVILNLWPEHEYGVI
ncbi:single-stranded-DNA-specific exonuclease RecJ [Acidithiobacillus caldus]|uniref:single-stranded-DNA-specific exonuclease RecJ n=1 Tax=Acidithiobacillus caldus TaxID=33059 RepID=UPI0009836FA2|nr:single-stranded-DNA-specific exonuclease RecJ [Acidithiobacillus caldus]